MVTGSPKGAGRIAGGFNHRRHCAHTNSPERTTLRSNDSHGKYINTIGLYHSKTSFFRFLNVIRWNMINDTFGCEEDNVVPSGLGEWGSCPVVETTGYTTFPLRGILINSYR
jgi:hypothetical protein